MWLYNRELLGIFFALARKTAKAGEKKNAAVYLECYQFNSNNMTTYDCLLKISFPSEKDMTSPSLMKLAEQVVITFSFLYFELTGPY